MQITRLDHVNIRTTQLQAMIAWYTNVLGLTSGPRPDFSFGGAWMYAKDTAVAHLVEIEGPAAVGAEVDLKLEHFAFRAKGAAEFKQRLEASGTKYREVFLSDVNLSAFNIWDPDGNHIHVDFEVEE